MRLVDRVSDLSFLFMSGAISLIILFSCLLARQFCTFLCVVFMFSETVYSEIVLEVVSIS